MNSILITGASGFIGQCLLGLLKTKNYKLRLGVRNNSKLIDPEAARESVFLDMDSSSSISEAIVKNIDIVIHLAGQAHDEHASGKRLYQVNAEGTKKLAEVSESQGVKLFIYISTIKVHGSGSLSQMFSEDSLLEPQDDYANSKLQGEYALIDICEKGKMQYVILRPPLVFGPGVKANFLKLLSLIDRNYPLPFANFNNLRSYIYVENLCHLIEGIIYRKSCRNQIYLVKDCDMSTKDLVSEISKAFGNPPNIFHMPIIFLKIIVSIFNKKKDFERLYSSLVIDNSRLQKDLGWVASVDTSTAMANTVDWYKQSRKGAN
ncbi:MAG: NAD-dependent epimerase/dehydratase family protein [Gammaproteobacteria bacterium]|nr:NAD-dependent epimerase/dehydratase family protein [Gammaproteobacteria bacterium]